MSVAQALYCPWRAGWSSQRGRRSFMGMNAVIPQIAASNAGSSSEPAGTLPNRAHRSTEMGSRKKFSTVLKTISRERDTEPSRKSGDRRPVDASDRGGRSEKARVPMDRTAQYQQSDSQTDKMAERRHPGVDALKGSDAPRADHESQKSPTRISESQSSQDHQESETWKNMAEEGSHPELDVPEAADVPHGNSESWLLGDYAHPASHIESSSLIEALAPAPLIMPSVAVGSGSEEDGGRLGMEHHEGSAPNPTPFGLTLVAATGLLPGHAASRDLLAQDSRLDTEIKHQGSSDDTRSIVAATVLQAHENPGSGVQSALGDVEQKAPDSHGGSRSAASPNGPPLLSQQADLDRTRLGSSAWPGMESVPSSRTSDSVHSAQAIQPDRPAPVVVPANAPALLQTDTYETKPLSGMPSDHQTIAEGAFQSGLDWSEQGGREHTGKEWPSAYHMAAAPVSAGFASVMAGEGGTAGTAALSMSRPVESSTVSSPAPAPPVPASRDAGDSPLSATARSVVFEVAETELGRINIRVALANEVVHTYLSSDRAEVGQFLINGQDRLQTALQANGLEMGQFRVDIDRQNAGRSFQQGPSQDQGRGWHHGSSQGDEVQVFEARDSRRSWSQGRLNLVA
jgi:Flagellar hook-length control protein FliK